MHNVPQSSNDTALNTGHKSGVVRLLEEYYEIPLKWLINYFVNMYTEMNFHCDIFGPTTGRREFSNPIGKYMVDCD